MYGCCVQEAAAPAEAEGMEVATPEAEVKAGVAVVAEVKASILRSHGLPTTIIQLIDPKVSSFFCIP